MQPGAADRFGYNGTVCMELSVTADMAVASTSQRQPWLHSAGLDLVFIIGPAFAVSAAVLVFPNIFASSEIPTWSWAVLILGVDVAHVYGTLFRTYLDPQELWRHPTRYFVVPLACWGVGVFLYVLSWMAFWRALAYLAVFHFVRQQYGFVALYSRGESRSAAERLLTGAAIYVSTLYPLLYWHAHLPRAFHWFVADDFVSLPIAKLLPWIFGVYAITLAAYMAGEIRHAWETGYVNWPRNLIIAGTALSWHLGIITFNGDLAFTATNIIAHGIPYMALVWIFGRRRARRQQSLQQKQNRGVAFFSLPWLPAYLGILIALAYFEEGLWHGFVWREHLNLFYPFAHLPALNGSILTWLVPLLALPQSTHYVLDGFIWRLRKTR